MPCICPFYHARPHDLPKAGEQKVCLASVTIVGVSIDSDLSVHADMLAVLMWRHCTTVKHKLHIRQNLLIMDELSSAMNAANAATPFEHTNLSAAQGF